MQTCSSCGQENPDGFRLCGMCGSSLTAAARAASEERKVVTIADATQSVDRARTTGDAQGIWPALSHLAFALFLAGRNEEALTHIEEVTAHPEFLRFADFTSWIPLLCLELGRPELYAEAAEQWGRRTVWYESAAAVVAGDLAGAADQYGSFGARLNEAWCRLLAAERGDLAQLERARTYFSEEEASVFLRRCEALLAASA